MGWCLFVLEDCSLVLPQLIFITIAALKWFNKVWGLGEHLAAPILEFAESLQHVNMQHINKSVERFL